MFIISSRFHEGDIRVKNSIKLTGFIAVVFIFCVSLFAAESGGAIIDIPGHIRVDSDTILQASWDDCLWNEQGGLPFFCNWTVALFAQDEPDMQVMLGRDGCELFAGDAKKVCTVLQFNIEAIPDSSVVNDIVLELIVDSVYANSGIPYLGCDDMLWNSTEPSGRGTGPVIDNLSDALGANVGNKEYFMNEAVASAGTLRIHLNEDGKTDFENQLVDNWFAVGLFIDNLLGADDTAFIGLSDIRTHHTLKVTYYPQLNITVRTDFDAGWVTIDDSIHTTSPFIANWEVEELHYINTDSVQTPGLGVKYLYRYWSDGGSKRHLISVSPDTLEYIAYFDTLYQLTLFCPSYGSVWPIHPDSTWFPPRDWSLIKAWPETTYEGSDSLIRHIFQGWEGTGTGSYTGSNDTAWVQMIEPITQYTVWDTSYWLELDFAGCGTGIPAQFGEGWLDVDDSVFVMTQESLEVEGAWYFFEFWTDAAGHLRDTTDASTWFVNSDMPRTIIANYIVNPMLEVFPEPYSAVSPGFNVYIPAILDADLPFPVDSFEFRMTFNDSKLNYIGLIDATIPWAELTAVPGTGEVTVFGDSPGSVMEVDPPETLFYFEMQATFGAEGYDTLIFDSFDYAFIDARTYDGYVQFVPEDISVTVTTDYGGDSVWIDASPVAVPYSDTWTGAATRNIGADSLNPLGTGEMARFIGWNDGGARFHDVNPVSDTTFTALFDTLLYLDVVSAYATPSGSGWFDRGETPAFSVSPEIVTTDLSRQVFTGWDGVGDAAYTGTDNPSLCTMNTPITETAQWQPQHWLELDFTGAGTATPTITGEDWIDEDSWTPIVADSIVDEARARFYFAWWSGGTIDDRYNHYAQAFITGPDTVTAVYADVPFTFALNIPETTIVPPSSGFALPVRFEIPTASELSSINFHVRFDASLSSYSNISPGDLAWTTLTGTDLSSGADGHVLVQASVTGSLPVNPDDRLCVLNFITDVGAFGTDSIVAGDPGGDISGATPDTGVLIIPGQVAVTISTSPFDGTVIIDSSSWSSPRNTSWMALSEHTISVDSIQYPDSGTQMLFTDWSDFGAREHAVVSVSDTDFTANFSLRYRLSVITDFGTPTGGGFYAPAAEAPFSVAPESVHVDNSYHLFQSWVGAGDDSYTGTANPALATVNEPISETAVWESHHLVELDYTGTPVAPTLAGDGWFIEGDTALIEAQDSVVDGLTWYYFIYWQGAGTVFDRYADSTGAIVDDAHLWTAVYGDSPANFLFGPPPIIPADGDGFVAVPVIFNGDPVIMDTIGFDVAFDTSLIRLENALGGTYDWSFIDISGPDIAPVITARSDTGMTIADGDTLLNLIFYVQALSGNVPLDFGSAAFDLSAGNPTDGEIRIIGTISITVQTDFGGIIQTDGGSFASPYIVAWSSGTEHQIGVTESQVFATGHRKDFSGWSDGKARTHYISPMDDSIFTAIHDDVYQLIVESPYGATSGSGWFDCGVSPEFSVSPTTVTIGDDRHVFDSWLGAGSGNYSGANNPANATMNGPIIETAQWQLEHYIETDFSGCPGETPTIIGDGWYSLGVWADISAPALVGGYSFDHWAGGIFADLNSPTTQLRVDSAATITAVYSSAGIAVTDSAWTTPGDTATLTVYAITSDTLAIDTIYMNLTFGGGILDFAEIRECGVSWDILDATPEDLGGGVTRVNVTAERAAGWPVIGHEDLFDVRMVALSGGVSPFDMEVDFVHDAAFHAIEGDRAVIVESGVDITLQSGTADSLYLDSVSYLAGSIIEVPYNSPHIASAPLLMPVGAGMRYRFDEWNDLPDRTRDIRPIADTTLTASYIQQYLIDATSEHGSVNGDGWTDLGDTAFVTLDPDSITIGDSIVYDFDIWSGDLTTGSNPCTVAVDGAYSIVAEWDTLYRVWVNSDYGTAITDGWCALGDSTLLNVSPTEVYDGATRHVFSEWIGAGGGSYSGATDSMWLHPTSPIHETAVWNLEHMLFVENGGRGTITGGGWYADADTAWFAIGPIIIDSTLTIRHVFDSWLGVGDSAYSGPDSGAYCRLNESVNQTATWQTEYFLAVNDGGHGTAIGAGWYPVGDSAAFSIDPDSEMVEDGVAWIFDSWVGAGLGSYSGSDNPADCWMSEPISESALWELRYQLTIIDSGALGLPEFEGAGWQVPHTWVPVSAPPLVISGSSRLSFLHWSGVAVADTLLPVTEALVDTACTLVAHYANFEVSPPGTMQVDAGDTLLMPVIMYYPYMKGLTTIQLDIYFPDTLIEYLNVVQNPSLPWSTIIPGIVSPGRLRVWANRSTIFVTPPETLFSVEFRSISSTARTDTIRFSGMQLDLAGANSTPGMLIIGAPIDVIVQSDYPGEGATVIVDDTHWDSPYEATWIAGEAHEIGVVPYYVSGNTRSAWDNWSDGGARLHTVAPFTADTFTAHYRIEHRLTIDADHGSSYGEGWYPEGDTAIFGLDPDSVREGSSEFVFDSWVGTGSGSYSGADNPSTCTMDDPVNERATYSERYELIVESARATTSGSGWFPPGWSAVFSVDEEFVDSAEGIRWVFDGWTGAYSGGDNPANWTVTGSNTQTATWHFEYLLTIESERGTPLGEGWYRAGSVAAFSIDSTVDSTAGIRYIFSEWTSPGGYNGTDNPAEIAMTGPITETANWDIEYYLAVESERATATGEGWFMTGDSAWFSVDPETVLIGENKHIFATWIGVGTGSYSGPDNPRGVRMDGSITEIADWGVEHELIVDGGPSATTGGGWYSHGAEAIFTVVDETVEAAGIRQDFAGWLGYGPGNYTGGGNPASCSMLGSITETAQFDTSYQIIVTSEHGVAFGDSFVATGLGALFGVTPDSIVSDGYKFLFAEWLGIGTGSFSGPNNPALAYPGEPITETAIWDTLYELVLEASGCGAATPALLGAGWNMAGLVDISAQNPVYDGADRYHFVNWSGATFEDEFAAETRITMSSADTATANYSAFEISPAESVLAASGDTAWVPILIYDIVGPLSIDSVGFDLTYDTGLLDYARIREDADIDWDIVLGMPGSPELTLRGFNASAFSIDPPETLMTVGFVVQSGGAATSPLTLSDFRYDAIGAGTINGVFVRSDGVSVEIRTAGVDDSVWIDDVAYASPYNDTWSPGESHDIAVRTVVYDIGGVRYRFIDWDDDPDSGRTVHAVSDTVFEANFATQYRFGVFNSGGDSPVPPVGNHWFDSGTPVIAMVTSPDPVTHWYCDGYDGTGDLTSGGIEDSVSFSITQPTSIYWRWLEQLPLVVHCPYGSPYPPAGTTWFAVGEIIDAHADSFVLLSPDSGMLCLSHIGTGSAPTGPGHTANFEIQNPSELTWEFGTAYRLTLAADGTGAGYPAILDGEGFYSSGAMPVIATSNTVDDSLFFDEWTSIPPGAAFAVSTDTATTITIDEPITAIANYARGSKLDLYKLPLESFGDFTAAGQLFEDTDHATLWLPDCWSGSVSTSVSDTATGGDSLWAFIIWSDSGAATHDIGPVCDDITLTAEMEKRYRTRLQKDPLWDTFGSMSIDGSVFYGSNSADTTVWWTEGSTYSISVSQIESDAADKRLVWDSWSDPGARTHTVGPVSAPDSIVAFYDREYLLTVLKDPVEAHGWIRFGSTTTNYVSTASDWFVPGETAEMEISTPDANVDTLWTFDQWTGGILTPTYSFGPVDTSHTFVATYAEEVVILRFSLDHSDWTIGEIGTGASIQMVPGEEIVLSNTGSHGLILGLQITDEGGWVAGYGNAEGRFALKGRFDDSPTAPITWETVDDGIVTQLYWASASRFGPGGYYISPATDENLWLRFISPISSSLYDPRTIIMTVYGQIALP